MNPIIAKVLANECCGNCVLRKRARLIAVRNKALALNSQYAPDRIHTLLVAESPPTSFYVQPNRYFYAPGTVTYGTLFYNMMKTLYENDMKDHKTKRKELFLSRFRDDGYYLVDMVKCPIDKLSKDDKAEAITTCSCYIKEELQTLRFRRSVFIGKGSFKRIQAHLSLSFRPQVISLPFGSQKNVEDFKNGLKTSLGIH